MHIYIYITIVVILMITIIMTILRIMHISRTQITAKRRLKCRGDFSTSSQGLHSDQDSLVRSVGGIPGGRFPGSLIRMYTCTYIYIYTYIHTHIHIHIHIHIRIHIHIHIHTYAILYCISMHA